MATVPESLKPLPTPCNCRGHVYAEECDGHTFPMPVPDDVVRAIRKVSWAACWSEIVVRNEDPHSKNRRHPSPLQWERGLDQ